jgi:hypothetical protein
MGGQPDGGDGWSNGGWRGLDAAKDRGRSDHQSKAARGGQQSAEGGDHCAVDPADLWSECASLQHGQLMAQDEDLDLSRRRWWPAA